MSTFSFLGRPLVAGMALLTAAAMLGGCSGSQSGITPQTSAPLQAHSPITPAKNCTYQGHIKVSPCSVTLTYSAPSATVAVKTNKHNSVTEADDCGGASGMATVTQNPSDPSQYIVAAGATAGSCSATFTATNKHGKTKGQATLSITNSI